MNLLKGGPPVARKTASAPKRRQGKQPREHGKLGSPSSAIAGSSRFPAASSSQPTTSISAHPVLQSDKASIPSRSARFQGVQDNKAYSKKRRLSFAFSSDEIEGADTSQSLMSTLALDPKALAPKAIERVGRQDARSGQLPNFMSQTSYGRLLVNNLNPGGIHIPERTPASDVRYKQGHTNKYPLVSPNQDHTSPNNALQDFGSRNAIARANSNDRRRPTTSDVPSVSGRSSDLTLAVEREAGKFDMNYCELQPFMYVCILCSYSYRRYKSGAFS